MLTDPAEIEIISSAKQKNVRDPNRSRQHFYNIIDDFFEGVAFNGRYVDLGPGQFDLGEILREKGGACVGVDFDPAVLALGRYKGFEVVDLNLRKLPDHNFGALFDGAFNKFSINAFWTPKDSDHERMIASLTQLVKPDGWGWIAPWNGAPKSIDYSEKEMETILQKQRQLFADAGFSVIELSTADSQRYGVHGAVENNCVFLKNLRWSKERLSA